ncbi:hypothetical protein A2962_04325 [Candidatus Woesebacteria bacterium RIFCSPLOWO2_01_FULL_39_61]|uniref:EfeO-type cupredoxin-like domain-containing protein n=1 Tax=Candidatus Woesebacteria bacterium RIFCSPHIGHO2_02_FULL_39_13 TaxID=1802505 RepID=A0A1F7Z5R3_9BACT|nr:MAG: hypothetical protein A2692_03450 [Candidatus Woesebacteria bacterium RIFCSPHIGHO2_01_FULL_39_95]OGM34907.1 MAG: hypothetical protein A3D01_00325 [Candidatus Woesebacteria bacterium RIFCSPHIGHO2_02_FULL_39_13]OGM37992.1 MAG: hypothetical protein A3E13_05320 [Candidatus Woesebacteria bacterium RIFCSPHIGHO2_12_FULL_40_20]OGM66608.1 MAG: hypothetical protein A2962_04325 [Candidatus Woesebacteria bacterium RIFCSPLOWO2_01_FULL_39_61]OGM71836.1 MAG: hypothetical protein A3H19_01730 [Candidatus
MEPEKPQAPESPSSQKAYGKKPMWQWVAIYVVIGVVIYGLVYYLYLSKRQTNPYSTESQNSNVSQTNPTSGQTTTSGNANDQTNQEEVNVTLTKSGFSPQTITISQGAKVIWTNESGTTTTVNSADHPTHLKYPPLNLGSFTNGESLSLVFDTPGTYGYHNHLNASQFGTVTVE